MARLSRWRRAAALTLVAGIAMGFGTAPFTLTAGASTPAAAARLTVTGLTDAVAGTAQTITVTALDGSGNVATGYTGTVSFSSSDGAAALPADYMFTGADAGVHVFSVTLHTAGSQTVTATDTVTSSITAATSTITVNSGAATPLVVIAPSAATVGTPVNVTVENASSGTVTGYTGTVHFTSTDGAASLPANYTFTGADAGVRSFSVTLHTSGNQSVTATDIVTPSTTGTSGLIAVTTPPPPPPPFFAPHNVGAPQVAVTPDGSQQIVFWKDTTTNQVAEAWYALVSWHGPVGFPQLGTLTSTPAVAVTKDGSQQLVFWEGPGGHLFEAWYALAAWHGPVDITNGSLGGHAILGSAPSVVTTTNGSELVFWRGADGHLGEAWYAAGGWHGPADFTSLGSLASSPSATITPDGSQQLVFFQATDNLLTEDWYALGSWHGPMELGALSSPPSVTVTPDGSTQLVFSKTAAGHLQESWYTLGSWHGPIDWTNSAFGGNGLLTSSPSATVTVDGSTQIVFWQGAGSTLWEGWYTLGAWHGPRNWSSVSSAAPAYSFNIAPVLQDMPLDCEAAALEEAARAKGRDVSQNTFFNELAKQPGSATWSGKNIARWGDPYVGFVGNVYRSESAGTGYGVYNGPLTSVAISQGFNAVDINNGDVGQLQSLVLQGDPVVIWTSNTFSPVAMRTWTAWDGRPVTYALTEHAVTVVGVDERAGTLTINDVGDGRMKTFTTSQFAAFWGSFGNMAVALE